MRVSIREVSPKQLGDCAAVVRRSFATVAEELGITRQNYPHDDGMFQKPELLAEEMENGSRMYALYAQREMAGFVTMAHKGGGVFSVGHLSVVPEHRHRGYGKALLDFALGEIRNMEGKKIQITIIEENTRLKAWYLRYGFVHTGAAAHPDLPFTVGYMEFAL